MKFFFALFVIAAACPGVVGGEVKSARMPGCWDTPFQGAEKLRKAPQREALVRALDLFQQALACNPVALPTARRAEILLGIGRVQLRLENNQQALSSLSSALELFHQLDALSNDLLKKQASGTRDKGLALRRLQNIDEALAVYHEARTMFHAVGDKSGESRTLQDIGLITLLMGENRDSLNYYREALKLSEGDVKQKSAMLDVIGRAYAQMNDLELANSYFQDALSLARKAHYPLFVAYSLNDLGTLLVKQRRPRAAETLHKEALAQLERYRPDDTDGIAETYSYLADAQRDSGRYAAAIQNYQRALLLQQQTGDVIGEAQTRVSLGLAATMVRDWELALQSLTRASELYHQVHERVGESNARLQMARVHILQGEDDRARDQAEAAIRLAEEVRMRTPGARLRTTYFASLSEMYRLKVDLLLKGEPISQSDQWLAFDTLQHAQSRTLLDVLGDRTTAVDFSCRQDLVSARDENLKKLKRQNLRMEQSVGSRLADTEVQQLFVSVRRLETALDEIEAQCQAEQPRFALLSASTISLPEIQEQILDPQSVLVQFYLADPYSYVWVITKSKFSLTRLPSKTWLEQQVRSVLKFDVTGTWTSAQETALKALHKELFSVFDVPGARRWVMVPDGALHNFPFALLSKLGMQELEIIKIPSASALWAIRKTTETAPAPPTKVAVFADPVFDAQDSRVKAGRDHIQSSAHGPPASLPRGHAKGASYARLLYSRQEGKLISSLVPANERVWFRDFDARLDAATGDALGEFKDIHFATHSVADNRHPDLSGVVLSLVARDGRSIPGYLFLKDIYRMRLHSDLVVLSSCSSASGMQDAGEGPMSLSRAFLYAGSRAVLASLWEADDEATAQLMSTFYRHMIKEQLSPSEALSRTQAQFRNHPNRRLRNPYYWAGFELYGDWLVQNPSTAKDAKGAKEGQNYENVTAQPKPQR